MSQEEIKELLFWNRWTHKDLADKLRLHVNTVDRWFAKKPEQRRAPDYAQEVLMSQWLADARKRNRHSLPA